MFKFKLLYLRNYKLYTNFKEIVYSFYLIIYILFIIQHFIFFYILFWFIKSFEYNIFLLILFKKLS